MADPENISLLPPISHNPDVLSCLANLSNDEVFTPPNVANAMLDMLPQELFKNPSAKFLDPVCKSGVFLREITKRLMKGLEKKIPDQQKRLDHILHNQVYGIAITELTSLLSRRTLYCAKYATSPYSICKFANIDGNIRFKAIQHTFDKNGKCIFCGASQRQYERGEELETHAYEFIHTDNPQEIFGDMKFDVIIGNPPYQLDTGGSKSQAIPIYQHFIEQAQKLNPKFLSMIIPDRWFSGGFGLSKFRNDMLQNEHLKILYIYTLASDCFQGVDIPGGICYFLLDKDYQGDCIVTVNNNGKENSMQRPLLENGCNIFIKYNEAISIINKVRKHNEKSFFDLVSSQKPFGLSTNFKFKSYQNNQNMLRVFGRNRTIGYVNKAIINNNLNIMNKYKLFIPAAYGERTSSMLYVLGKPFVGQPGDICTETYIAIGPFDDAQEAKNAKSYMETKFMRFLVLLHKATQHTLKNVYTFVPIQNFSKPWTDVELYAKYNLTQDEIDFIESMIKPMDISPEIDNEAENA